MEEYFKILVIDDDEVDRMAVRRALRAANIQADFIEAWDYSSAISILQDSVFDCIFVDYRLPDKDGLVLVQDLRQSGVKTPLVVLTGQGDEQIAVELMKAGATDYLPKSKVLPESLARILRNAVRIYRIEMEAESAKQQREQLARQREDFVYRLTHDLRTPLVAADRMYTLLKQDAFGTLSPEMIDAINIMTRSNQNLLQMVNTILEVYRHDAGHKTLSFGSCDLAQIIQEVVQELSPLAQEKSLNLEIDFTNQNSQPVVIMGDRLELQRVLTNLVGNALKFTDQGSIIVRLSSKNALTDPVSEETGAIAVIEVQDTGSGITPEDQKVLFERFRQGENKRSGSGLGLYLSRRIVEAHNGAIHVQSELGKGSTFVIQLPFNYREQSSSQQSDLTKTSS